MSKKSEKNKGFIVISTFEIDMYNKSAYISSDFLFVGTQNSDLSKVNFGQKLPKADIVNCEVFQF